MKFPLSHAAVAVALAAASMPALAQSSAAGAQQRYSMPYERAFWNYGGVAVGRSDYDVGCRAGFPCDTDATALKLFGGGQFSEFLGLEASYVWLGNADRGGGHTRAHGINLSLVGTVPLGQAISVNGKIGGIYGWTKTEGRAGAGFTTGDEHDLGLSYGVGLKYALTRTVDVRLDWDRYRMKFATGNDDVNLLSVGVAFKF